MRARAESFGASLDASRATRAGDAFVDSILKTSSRTSELEEKDRSGRIFTMILFMLFVTVMLIAILIGTSVFSALRTTDAQIEESRLSLVLIPNIIRASDEANAVSEATGPEGPALVLTERLETGAYETRIYKHDGYIVQEYALAGTGISPDAADPIVESDVFGFELADGLLTVRTDDGETSIAMRSLVGVR